MYEIYGELRSLFHNPPSIKNFNTIVELLAQESDELVRDQLLPYCQSKMKSWPDHLRTISEDSDKGWFPSNQEIWQLIRRLEVNLIPDPNLLQNPNFKEITHLGSDGFNGSLVPLLHEKVIKNLTHLKFIDAYEISDHLFARRIHKICTSYPSLEKLQLNIIHSQSDSSKFYRKILSGQIKLNEGESTIKELDISLSNLFAQRKDPTEELAHYKTFDNVESLRIDGYLLYDFCQKKCFGKVKKLILVADAYDHLSEILADNLLPNLKYIEFLDGRDVGRYLKKLNIDYQTKDPRLQISLRRLKKMTLKSTTVD